MVDLTTTNYAWVKPTTGADIGIWGPIVNTNYDNQDTTVFAISGVANAAMPRSGGTFTGPTVHTTLSSNGAAATSRPIQWQTATVNRWVAAATNTAESGSNVGSDWALGRYTDAGAFVANAILINRATGLVTVAAALTVGGNLSVGGTITGAFTNANGSILPAMLSTGGPSWDTSGNLTASGSLAGPVYLLAANAATGAAVQARISLTTGTANSQVFHNLADSSGAPTYQVTVGSAVTGVFTDIDTQVWRTRSGTERMRLDSSGRLGLGTTGPIRLLHLAGTNPELAMQATNGLADFRDWTLLSDGGSGSRSNFYVRLLNDAGTVVQWIGMSLSGVTGVANFPQGLTSNGAAVVLATDGRLTGLPTVTTGAGTYNISSTDYGGCVHCTANCTVTIPAGITIGTAFEVSCDSGVTVSFSYANTARTVPANSTAAHTMLGPGATVIEQKKSTEIWLRGDAV